MFKTITKILYYFNLIKQLNEIKILVTGSAGLLGKSLQKIVKEHLEKGCKNAIYRFYFLTRKDCNLIDVYSVYDIFYKIKPHIVIHLASVVGGVYENMNNNYNMFMDNTRIHLNIIDACQKFNIKKLIN